MNHSLRDIAPLRGGKGVHHSWQSPQRLCSIKMHRFDLPLFEQHFSDRRRDLPSTELREESGRGCTARHRSNRKRVGVWPFDPWAVRTAFVVLICTTQVLHNVHKGHSCRTHLSLITLYEPSLHDRMKVPSRPAPWHGPEHCVWKVLRTYLAKFTRKLESMISSQECNAEIDVWSVPGGNSAT